MVTDWIPGYCLGGWWWAKKHNRGLQKAGRSRMILCTESVLIIACPSDQNMVYGGFKVIICRIRIAVPISTTNMLALRPLQNAMGIGFCKVEAP